MNCWHSSKDRFWFLLISFTVLILFCNKRKTPFAYNWKLYKGLLYFYWISCLGCIKTVSKSITFNLILKRLNTCNLIYGHKKWISYWSSWFTVFYKALSYVNGNICVRNISYFSLYFVLDLPCSAGLRIVAVCWSVSIINRFRTVISGRDVTYVLGHLRPARKAQSPTVRVYFCE